MKNKNLNIFRNKSFINKTWVFSIISFVGVVTIAFTFYYIYSKNRFFGDSRYEMQQLAMQKKLTFLKSVESEISIALQMSNSPIIRDYLKNPEDSQLKKLGVREFGSYMNSFGAKNVFWVCHKNLEYYSDLKYVYNVDKDADWYNATYQIKEDYAFNIQFDVGLKKTNLWLNVPVREDGNNLGICGTGIDLTSYIDKLYEELNDQYELYFYNDKLEITGARLRSVIEDKVSIKDMYPDVENWNTTDTMYIGEKCLYYTYPISQLHWNILVVRPFDSLLFANYSILNVAIIVIIFMTIVMLIYVVFIRQILKRFKLMVINTGSKVESQKTFMKDVNETISGTVNGIKEFEVIIKDNKKSIKLSNNQVESLQKQLSLINQLKIDSINDARNLEENSLVGVKNIQDLYEKTQELLNCSQELEMANVLIDRITSKTDTLSVNAAIEAARAGANGEGFSVVARQVRGLAEKSAEEQKKIASVITKINALVNEMAKQTWSTKETFENINSSTLNVQDNFVKISQHIDNQQKLGREIGLSLKQNIENNEKVSEKFLEIKAHNISLKMEIDTANKSIEELLQNIDKSLIHIGKINHI